MRRRRPAVPPTHPRAVLLCCAVLALGLSACGGDDGSVQDTTTSTTSTTAGTDPGSGAVGPDEEDREIDLGVAVGLRDLDLGLDAPIAAVSVPESTSMLVAERVGRVREVRFDDGAAEVLDGVLLDLVDRVGTTESERGLLGIAVSPEGDSLVVSYTSGDDGSNQLERYDLDGGPGALRVDESSRRSLLTVDQPYPNHNGGHIAVGPDGFLYVGIGDGGSGGDPEGNAQDPTTLLGKMLRIDAFGAGDELVPPDNPFVDRPDGARPEIWATGVRNPWRFSFDEPTGDLWIADVGQNAYEELNRLTEQDDLGRGANLGWDLYEGTEPFDDADPAPAPWSEPPFVDPVYTYGRDLGCSITGGRVYRGEAIPALVGAYLFADFCGDGVRGLVLGPDGPEMQELDNTPLSQIVSFAETPSGELVVLSLTDGVHLLEPAG